MDIVYTTISSSVVLAVLAFLFRNLIETRLTNAVKHEYDDKLENIKSKLKADNDVLVSELAHLSNAKLQRNTETRKIKQEHYHMFLEALSIKFSHLKQMDTEDAILANKRFCIEVNRLPLYASQDIVEFVSKYTGDRESIEFTALYELIREDLCSDTYDSFENLSEFYFQVPD